MVVQLLPEKDDYFVLKPKHSAFYQTNLEILLNYLGVRTLIMTGMAADICVLFSANDAYMRDFRVSFLRIAWLQKAVKGTSRRSV